MSLFVSPVVRATDANMIAQSGASWYFYLSNTLTPHTVYSDWQRTTPHTNPVVADSGGLFPLIFLDPNVTYRAILKDTSGQIIQDVDPVFSADRELRLDLAATTGALLMGTSSGDTVQEHLDQLGTKNEGVLSNTGDFSLVLNKTASGNSGGASDWRVNLLKMTYTGGYGTTNEITGAEWQNTAMHTAGTVTFFYGMHGYNELGTGSSGSSTGAITTARGIEWHTANKSSNAKAIASAANFWSGDVDLDRSGVNGTIGAMTGFYCGNIGHATRVTVSAVAFDCANMTAGAPVTASYRTAQSSGTGCYAFLGTGSAPAQNAGAFLSSQNANGYATGAGGTVTQTTSKSTGVTIDKACGAITLNNASLAANTIVSFTLTNAFIGANDHVHVWVKSGNASVGSYRVATEGNASGSRTVVVENKTGGALGEAIVLGFYVQKVTVS